jgi:hypothetical protein
MSLFAAHRAIHANCRSSPYSVWNFANAHTLVIVTANVSPGTSDQAGGNDQIVDLEIIDGSHAGSKYLSKKVSPSAHELRLWHGVLST